MAQKQNNASKNDISSRSFDEILERMRSRVSEISEGGDVDKVLQHEQTDASDAEMGKKVVLTEEEQDRAFLKMAKKQSATNPKKTPEDDKAQEKALDAEPEMTERRADQTSVMDVTKEGEFELETYQQILSALEMKDLSKVSDNTDTIDEIVARKAVKAEAVALPETVSSPSPLAGLETTKQPYEDSFVKPAVEETSIPTAEEKIKPEMEAEGGLSSSTFDRLAMVANSLEKSLDDKNLGETKKETFGNSAVEITAVETEARVAIAEEPVSVEAPAMKQETIAARSVSADIPAIAGRDTLSQQDPVEMEQAIALSAETTETTAASLPMETATVPANNASENERDARFDRIEETLKLLMTTQVQNEDKASEMLKKQEESFLKMTAEAQKVAEATAAKVALQSSSEVALEAVKKHSAPQDDVMTLKEELKVMNARLADNIEKQKDAYELVQIALEALHEKIGVIQEESKKPSTAAVFVNPSEDILRQQQFSLKNPEEDSKDETPIEPALEEKVAPVEEEEIVEVKEEVIPEPEQPISAQVLRAFVNAPLIGSNQNADVKSAAVGQDAMAHQDDGELPMPAPRQTASSEHQTGQDSSSAGGRHTTDFSGHTYQQRFESLVKDKKKPGKTKKGSANSSVMLAISSMLMFSVSGYLFYNQLQPQDADLGAPEVTASISQPATQSVAQNDQHGAGLVGEKKLVQWSYSGAGKSNIARLSSSDKALKSESNRGYSAVTSDTEIIEVAGADQGVPTVTGSLGNHSALSFSKAAGSNKKLRNGAFSKPALSIGSSSLRQAASKGVASAMFEVARRYQNGKGVKKDYIAAAKWYRRSADKGYAPAQYRLGTLYERGRGVAKNIQQARDWYRLAAKMGNVKAMHNLGVIFSGQKQIKADYVLATKWFTRAAQYGLADSQFNLAIINYNGLGKKRNLEEAYKWFALAAKNGDKAAKEQKDNLGQKMKIRQLMDSRRKVSSWKTLVPAKSANIDLAKKYFWRDYAEM